MHETDKEILEQLKKQAREAGEDDDAIADSIYESAKLWLEDQKDVPEEWTDTLLIEYVRGVCNSQLL